MTRCLDSSIILDFIGAGTYAEHFDENAYCSTLALFEVEKILLRKLEPKQVESSMEILKTMLLTIPVDIDISSMAAKLSIKHKLAMADSIMLATAQSLKVILYTKDSDFRNISGVKVI